MASEIIKQGIWHFLGAVFKGYMCVFVFRRWVDLRLLQYYENIYSLTYLLNLNVEPLWTRLTPHPNPDTHTATTTTITTTQISILNILGTVGWLYNMKALNVNSFTMYFICTYIWKCENDMYLMLFFLILQKAAESSDTSVLQNFHRWAQLHRTVLRISVFLTIQWKSTELIKWVVWYPAELLHFGTALCNSQYHMHSDMVSLSILICFANSNAEN